VIKAEFIARDFDPKGYPTFWEFKLTGGEFSDGDALGNLAPAEGYKPEFTMSSRDFDRGNSPGKDCYFRSTDQKVFASFRLEPQVSKRGESVLRLVDLKVNPAGSPNLEFDPKKAIIIRR
jgi:hypothetical protein